MPSPGKSQNPWRQLGLVLSMGVTFTAAVVIGVLLGLWLDARLGTKPLFTLILAGLGFVAGVVELLRALKALDKQ